MKMKYLIMVSLVLAIITIGAVSAADDSDNLTAEIDTVDEISQASDVDITSDTGEDAVSNDDSREDAYYRIITPEKVKPGGDSDEVYSTELLKNTTYIELNSWEISGNLSILVDGNEKFATDSVSHYTQYSLDLASLGLTYGLHNVTFKYSGDSQYRPFTENRTFEYYYFNVEVPNPVVLDSWREGTIIIEVPYDATGKIDLSIDGQNKKTFDAYEDRIRGGGDGLAPRFYDTLEYQVEDLSFNQHSYTIRYYNGNYPEKTVSGSFNVTYQIDIYTDSYLQYGDNITFRIQLPYECEEDVQVTANGKSYTAKYDWAWHEFTFTEAVYGENNFTFTYQDSNHPKRTIYYPLNITSRIDSFYDNENIAYGSDDKNITLMLPKDAKGNLSAYLEKYINGDYNYTLIKTTQFKDGMASLSISDMDLGSYIITFKYDGDDYPVNDITRYLKIVPNLIYPKGIWNESEEEYNITVISPESATGNLTISIYATTGDYYDYDYTQTLKTVLYNSTCQPKIDLKMPKLEAGTYSLEVTYTDDYGNLKTNNPFSVRNTNPNWQMEIDFPSELSIDDEGENYIWYRPKNLPSDADGKLTLYIDGEKKSSAIFGDNDYECEWYYSSLSNGNHTWKLEYTGDSYYKDTSVNGTFKLIKLPIKIEMYDDSYLNNDYFAEIYADEDVNGTIIVLINGKEEFRKSLQQFREEYEGATRYEIGPSDIDYSWETKSYEIEVKYVDGNYDNVTASKTVEIRDRTDINIKIYNAYIDDPDDYFASINAPYDAKGTVIVLINGEEKLRKSLRQLETDEDGDYIIRPNDVEYKWKVQSYNIEVRYAGGNYEDASKSKTVNMTYNDYEEPSSSGVVVNTYNYAYLDSSTDYFASVSAPQGTTGTITVLINGKDKFEIPLDQCSVNENGEYVIGPKDINYNWEKQSYTIEVKFTDGNNNVISRSNTVEMKNENGANTNNNGAGQGTGTSTPTSNTGTATAGTTTTGTTQTKAKEVVKLTLAKVNVKKSAKKLVIKVTLKINGKWAKGKKITFKFNGKKYTAKTNKKGVAKITVKKAILKKLRAGKKVTYTATYNKKTVKKSVKVKK